MREVYTLLFENAYIIGTKHTPVARKHNIVFLFFNSGQAPRSGHGDLFVSICEDLCHSGYISYRIDLPGLGDSKGFVSREEIVMWSDIISGKYDRAAIKVTGEIIHREHNTKLVIGGLCGGAVISSYLVDLYKKNICGLILLEPYLLNIQNPKGNFNQNEIAQIMQNKKNVKQKLFSVNSWKRFFQLKSDYSLHCKTILSNIIYRKLDDEKYNKRMIDNIKKLIESKVPIILFFTYSSISDQSWKRIFGYRHFWDKRVSRYSLHETNHIFTKGEHCKKEIIKKIVEWINNISKYNEGGLK